MKAKSRSAIAITSPKPRKTARKSSVNLATSEPDSPEKHPLYQPPEQSEFLDPSRVIVDFEVARIPKSDLAKEIGLLRKGDATVEGIRRSRGGPSVIHDINPYDLNLEEGWNKRIFETLPRRESIASLGLSIANEGVKEPLVAHIKHDKVWVHSGWNRWFATIYAIEVCGAAIRTVPVRFSKASENDSDWMLSQIVNNNGDRYLKYETALVIKQLVNFGWTEADIARRIGRSETSVKDHLNLLGLPASILKYVEAGTISSFHAHMRWTEFDHNEEPALEMIESAIEHSPPGKRVLPGYAVGKERKPRTVRESTSQERTGRKQSADSQVQVSRLVVLTRKGRVIERVEDKVLVEYDAQDFEEIEIIADLPAMAEE